MLDILLILAAQSLRTSAEPKDAELGNILLAGAVINLVSKVK